MTLRTWEAQILCDIQDQGSCNQKYHDVDKEVVPEELEEA